MICRLGVFLLSCFLASCAAPQSSPTLGEIASGQVEVVDLGYALNEQNPYWPGEGYSPFHFEILATLEADGVYSGAFSTAEHLGTHLDAPNHFEPGQPSVDQIKLEELIAPLVVVDIRENCRSNPDYRLSREDLETWEKQNGPIPPGSVVFGLTGWGQYWNDYERYKNQDISGQLHFPGFSEAAALFLVEEREIRGIGIDTLSVDYGLSTNFSIHHIVNGEAAYHIENAANLDKVPLSGAWVMIAPIKIEQGSGGPARVWAVFR
jgi:kynurenine formamidase